MIGLILLLTVSAGGAVQADRDCRMIGPVMHCFNPPPPTPLSKAEIDARRQETIRDELEIMRPFAMGMTPENCRAVTALARAKGRMDLAQISEKSCGQ